MGGILRMTPGLSMCPMQRLILGSFVLSWHSCFSGEMCLCQPGKESKWTDSSWCECNWRITSSFCLAWLSSLISSGLGRTRASQEQNGAHKGTNLPDLFVFEKLCHDFIKLCQGGGNVGGPIQWGGNINKKRNWQSCAKVRLITSQLHVWLKQIFTYSYLLEL